MASVSENPAKEEINKFKEFSTEVWDYLTSEGLWNAILEGSIKIIGILVISYLAVFLGKRIINNVFKISMRSPLNHSERRQKTILKLLQSVVSYIVYFSAILAILSVLDINVAG